MSFSSTNGVCLGLLRLVLLSLSLTACSKSADLGATALSFEEFKELEAQAALPSATSPNCTDKGLSSFSSLSCQELRQEFRYVVYIGKQIYCYTKEKTAETGINFELLAQQLESKITDQTTYSEYFTEVLRPWAGAFHDGHVNAMPGSDLSRLEILRSGIKITLLGAGTDHERVFVKSSKHDEIQPNSEILKINGLSVRDSLDKWEPIANGSTRRMRRLAAGWRLLDRVGAQHSLAPLELEYRSPGQTEIRKISVTRQFEINLPPTSPVKEEETTGEDLVTIKVLPGNIGYLRIDGFEGTQMPLIFDQAMKSLRMTRGLILDVRENGGGDQSGNRILRWLTDKKIERYRVSPIRSDFLLSQRPELLFLNFNLEEPGFYEWKGRFVEPSSPDEGTYVGKPVAVLTSPYCFSACDTFVSGIQANKLGTIIGEATGGGTGSPLVFSLPGSNIYFRYSVVRGLTANGAPIEGVGTLPDIEVEFSEADLSAGHLRDSQVQGAVKFILARLEGENTQPSAGPHLSPLGVLPALSGALDTGDESDTLMELRRLKRSFQTSER